MINADIDCAELSAWIALNRIVMRAKGMTPELYAELRERLFEAGSAQEVVSLCKARPRGGGVMARLALEFRGFKQWAAIEKEAALVESSGVSLITIIDKDYPTRLAGIYCPPILLYATGCLQGVSGTSIFNEALPAVAIVGTRRASHYAIEMAEAIGRDLARKGIVIVSGMARGCDSAAHRGALEGGGLTIAVLGTGVDTVYPAENKKLHQEIKGSGLVVSEFPMETAPLPMNFPLRNRIISGLSMAVVVVEAPLRSGAMMTARMALEEGREVFALPGRAGNPGGSGTNKLIKDGAQLVESAEDIIKALMNEPAEKPGFEEGLLKENKRQRPTSKRSRQSAQASGCLDLPEQPSSSTEALAELAGTDEAVVLGVLGDGALHIDAIAERSGVAVPRLAGILLDMELKGVIAQKPGKLFIKKF
jgi:DNA processing protein